MQIEIRRVFSYSPARMLAYRVLSGRHSAWITCLVLFLVQGCALIPGPPANPVPADTTSNSQPAIETSITPEPTPSPPVKPKVSTKEKPSSEAKFPQTGEASWYGPKFHGKTTASGETFNQEALTAAHASLPLGSKVKVTNLSNGKSVDVEINDRGPFAENRIIDLSRAAAKALDMKEDGTAKVRLEPLSSQ